MPADRPSVLLIYPPNSGSRPGLRGIYYPLGIGYIAAVLENDFNVSIRDLNYDFCVQPGLDDRHADDAIRNARYDFLLIGGVFPKHRIVKRLIECSRRYHPDSSVILGGSYLKPSIDVLAPYFQADYYVLGEGEEVIPRLLSSYSDRAAISALHGVAYHEAGTLVVNPPHMPERHLDEIPFPARHLVPFDRYKRYFAVGYPLHYTAYMIGSRGCNLNCIFCNPAFGRKVRVRTPENIIEEVCKVQKDYGCHFIYFHDELALGGAKDRIVDFCEYVLRRKGSSRSFRWGGTTNPLFLDEKTLNLMSNAGCVRLSFGIESGSRKILKEMRKTHNAAHLKKVVACCDSLGIEMDFSLLTNTFSETKETLAETKDYLTEFNRFYFRRPMSLNYITPIPGTDIYDEAKSRGLLPADDLENLLELADESRYGLWNNLTELPKAELTALVDDVNQSLFSDYYQKHPLQRVVDRFSNLGHFRYKETLRSMSADNLRPALEGLLWALSRGDERSVTGRLFKRIVHG